MGIKRGSGIYIQAVIIVTICVAFSYVSDASNSIPGHFRTDRFVNVSSVSCASLVNAASEAYSDSLSSVSAKDNAVSLATKRAVPAIVPFYFFGVVFLLMLKKGWIQVNRRSVGRWEN